MQITTIGARTGLAIVALAAFGLAGCDAPPTGPAGSPPIGVEPEAASMSAAPFQLWRQGFNHGTDGWVTDDVPGPAGWCGDIETAVRGTGPVPPAAGEGYAIVTEGDCNAFHQGRGFLTSGPAAGFMPINRTFPDGGYIQDLDIYLDPDWADGTGFGYVISFQDLDDPIPFSYRYLQTSVMKSGGTLTVAGETIDEAGWYTFRHRFYDDAGTLGVEFQLVRDGHVHASESLSNTPTLFLGETPASLPASNTGSGYLWFSYISPGLDLPIDEQQLRRGR